MSVMASVSTLSVESPRPYGAGDKWTGGYCCLHTSTLLVVHDQQVLGLSHHLAGVIHISAPGQEQPFETTHYRSFQTKKVDGQHLS